MGIVICIPVIKCQNVFIIVNSSTWLRTDNGLKPFIFTSTTYTVSVLIDSFMFLILTLAIFQLSCGTNKFDKLISVSKRPLELRPMCQLW